MSASLPRGRLKATARGVPSSRAGRMPAAANRPFALDHLAAKKERHWCSSLRTAMHSKQSRQVAVIRNAKVRKMRKAPSIILLGRAPYPDNPRSLRNWCGERVLDEFLHPDVAIKTLTPKQPPLPAQCAAHQPLSRQRGEAAKNYKIRLGNIR